MPKVHPTALLDSRARLADDVCIGPYVVIEGAVAIGSGAIIGPHTVINGNTQIGAGCRIGPAAYVGLDPQHAHYDEAETWLVIGDGAIIREGASVHRSIRPGIENATRVGAQCFLMGASHVGHDCQLKDAVVLANGVLLGGHCEIGAGAFLGGGCVVHQFCKVGRLVIVSGNEAISRDIPPFAAVRYGGIKGYNAVGCRRAGIARDAIHAIRATYGCLHACRTTPAAIAAIRELQSDAAEVREILDFIGRASRGVQPSVRFLSRMRQGVGLEDD
jgi:UDP-N-acetylglucosamine acyltransferase